MKPFIDNDEDHFDIGFEQFKLRPGLELELHDSSGRLLDHKAQFIMAFSDRGVLISFRMGPADKTGMNEGERYQVSGFNGRFDFSFTSQALKVDPSQFTALLAIPAKVSIHFVRRHPRKDLALAAAVTLPSKETFPVTIRNLSLGGAAIDSVKPLGAEGGSFNLLIQVVFENKKEVLNLVAQVRRSSASDESLMFRTGVEFVNASRTDKLLLHYYISTVANEFILI
ncbi:MAG TPA: PilZ domain-containing protein [Gallionellaceae bacterium]